MVWESTPGRHGSKVKMTRVPSRMMTTVTAASRYFRP
ncbi:DUF1580 domain-containing protein [Helcobacillus massiliensis]